MKLPLVFILITDVVLSSVNTSTNGHPILRGSGLNPDAQKFLEGVALGMGLYYELPYIDSLTSITFDRAVINKTNSWVIEFYQSWCGYCLRYTTTFKRFAKDLQPWRPVVRIGAVDCSYNTGLCRRFGVVHVPSLKYIPPHFNDDLSTVVQLDQRYGHEQRKTPAQLRQEIVTQLKKRPDLPQLKNFKKDLPALWSSVPAYQDWAVAVTNCKDNPTFGPQIVLDYWHTKSVKVFPLNCSSPLVNSDRHLRQYENSTVYLLNRDNAKSVTIHPDPADSRLYVLEVLWSYLVFWEGVNVPHPFHPMSIPNLDITKQELLEFAKTHGKRRLPFEHSGLVFQVDLEAAIDESIVKELGQARKIQGEAYEALVQYLKLIKTYFPASKNGKRMFKCLYDNIKGLGKTTGYKVMTTYESCKRENLPVYLDPDNGYMGCRGSLPMYRGFPCTMWMMFHTLNGQAHRNKDPDPMAVLGPMIGYIKNFFACQDCAEHFLAMVSKMPKLNSTAEAVLWLSQGHNKANKRLHGDMTEDPNYPKVQFPPEDLCPLCRNPDGSFNEEQALKFLDHMYTNIDQRVWADIPLPPTPLHKMTKKTKRHQKFFIHHIV